ncbi:MAG: DUF5106 domain-containing protein [Chitinophagia bacterium]|nr:DUF5106 domain-containing protein [Chitinophagia bacterium]
MKKIITTVLSFLLISTCFAQSKSKDAPIGVNGNMPGYQISLKMPGVHDDSMVYLVHYYGKGGGTIYKSDSAKFKKGIAKFNHHDSFFCGGSYMLLLSDGKTFFEFLLDRNDNIEIEANMNELPFGLKFKGTGADENIKFLDYQRYAKEYGEKQQGLLKELKEAKSKADTNEVRKKGDKIAKEFADYRKNMIKDNKGTLLSAILSALEKPEVPEGDHFLADGKTKDSTFGYKYYKAHFWDGFNFQDDRLIYTPLYDGMLDEYMNKMVVPWTDSVQHECDMLLKKVKGTRDLFHYTLWWTTRFVENSKVMGISDVFVHLVEQYYMKGDAFWLTPDELQKYYDRARKMAPNVIGNIAPELKLPNVITKKEESMMNTKAKYTLVVFYSPNCGHCQHELPALDSAYEQVLKDKGVKVFTVSTEGDDKTIPEFLVKNKLDKKWINTWDPEHTSNYHNNYDVYSTPTIYLLDDRKVILGKRLDHTNVGSLIDATERKARDKAAGKL